MHIPSKGRTDVLDHEVEESVGRTAEIDDDKRPRLGLAKLLRFVELAAAEEGSGDENEKLQANKNRLENFGRGGWVRYWQGAMLSPAPVVDVRPTEVACHSLPLRAKIGSVGACTRTPVPALTCFLVARSNTAGSSIVCGDRLALRKLITSSFKQGGRDAKAAALAATPLPAQEPDYVYFVMRALVPNLARRLSLTLRPVRIPSAVTGVFCHGSPLVDFLPPQPPGGCELGDLLIVVHYRHSYGEEINALLLQAKLDEFPHQGDAQWRLYNSWPLFIWRSGPRYVRWPRPSGPHLGAQHLVLYRDNRRGAQTRVVDSNAKAVPAADEVADALCLRSGRRIKDRPLARYAGKSGWSEVVWDLLDETAAHTVTRARSGVSKEPRAAGSMLFASTSAVPSVLARAAARPLVTEWVDVEQDWAWSGDLPSDDGEGPPMIDEVRPPDDQPGRISTIVIEIGPPGQEE